jgi:multidrug resistance efflux pump
MQFVQAVPAAGGVVLDLIAKNMDWPGAQDIARRLQKTLPPGILDQDEMEEAGIEPPQPSPEQQASMAQAQADMEKAKADTAKAQADMAMAQAKTAEAQAKLAEIEQACNDERLPIKIRY